MVALAVIGLVAAGLAHNRSDEAAEWAGLPLIELSMSGNDVAHFDRIYSSLTGVDRDSRFYQETTAGGGRSSDTTARSTPCR